MRGGHKLLLWIGIIILLVPFLGVPIFWKEIVLFLLGLTLIIQSLIIKSQKKTNNVQE